jgi:hypothetical protein
MLRYFMFTSVHATKAQQKKGELPVQAFVKKGVGTTASTVQLSVKYYH